MRGGGCRTCGWVLTGVADGVEDVGVEVVGERAPADPCLGARGALEAAALEPVAVFEVADAAFAAGAVGREPAAGALAGAGGGAGLAGDEHPFGLQRLQQFLREPDREA